MNIFGVGESSDAGDVGGKMSHLVVNNSNV